MEKCLGCGRYFKEEDLTDTTCFMGEGWESDLSGYYCDDCLEGKEVCSYCGVPTDYIELQDGDIGYCADCVEELKDTGAIKEVYKSIFTTYVKEFGDVMIGKFLDELYEHREVTWMGYDLVLDLDIDGDWGVYMIQNNFRQPHDIETINLVTFGLGGINEEIYWNYEEGDFGEEDEYLREAFDNLFEDEITTQDLLEVIEETYR